MRILYFTPHLNSIYAGRTIWNGYKNAFTDMGHEFKFLTADDDQEKIYKEFNPEIIFTSLNSYSLKFMNLTALKNQKKAGSKVFVNAPFWNSPLESRANEASSLKNNQEWINLIKSADFGDIYFHSTEQNDERMNGFEKGTGHKYYTIPLAADKLRIYPEYSDKFKSDIAYIGTYLPEKRNFIDNQVFPLKSKYNLKLYGQDWTFSDRTIGLTSKIAKYFNIPYIRDLQKPKLEIEDERKIYSSATISINIHEDYQKKYGGDCNERTFKIPLANGFEITDDVSCIRKYFEDDKEIVIAKNKDEWFDKIDHYIRNPEKRINIIDAGRKKVLENHTYHNRVESFLNIYGKL
jgi:spore maturation protein CgeB